MHPIFDSACSTATPESPGLVSKPAARCQSQSRHPQTLDDGLQPFHSRRSFAFLPFFFFVFFFFYLFILTLLDLV